MSACDREERAQAEAFAVILPVLDRDGDGAVREAEYLRVAYKAPPFAEADRDGDGALEAQELLRLVRSLDPVRFDPQRQQKEPARQVQKEDLPATMSDEALQRFQLYWFLAEEALAAGAQDLPSDEELKEVAVSGDPLRRQELRDRLRAAYESVDLPFPQLP